MAVPRKRQRPSPTETETTSLTGADEADGETTDVKLAILASLHSDRSHEVLLDYLLAYDGSVEAVSSALSRPVEEEPRRKRSRAIGYQSSLSGFASTDINADGRSSKATKSLTKKGRTLHLYSPKEIEAHCPCSIIHNFLPVKDADAVVEELLREKQTFQRDKFVLFEREVQSPHTSRFYVNSYDEAEVQKNDYYYNGGRMTDVGQTPPQMLKVCGIVEETVNVEIQRRIRDCYPGGTKLKFQSPERWRPNASFVNCYDGAHESVGWHSDQLTYLGSRAIIGSLSLGVAREFRIRRIVPQIDASSADEQGQIAIHLPHNSLLIMHAEMQEEYKHSIAPAQVIEPHPLAGNNRFNITYRCYKDYLSPKYTPHCKCNVPCLLRCMQKRELSRGRYMWQCHASYAPGQTGCSYFAWAEIDQDGKPPWVDGYKGNSNLPQVFHGDSKSESP